MTIGINKESYHTLFVSDAFYAGSLFLKACLQLLKEAKLRGRVMGFQSIEACFNFEEVIEIMQKNKSSDLIIKWG